MTCGISGVAWTVVVVAVAAVTGSCCSYRVVHARGEHGMHMIHLLAASHGTRAWIVGLR